MKNEKNSFLSWVKSHKKALIVAGISITTLIALILGMQNREKLLELWLSLQETLDPKSQRPPKAEILISDTAINTVTMPTCNNINYSTPVDVSGHIRNLHEGWRASENKITTAAANGYVLQPTQTWVTSYKKGLKAA